MDAESIGVAVGGIGSLIVIALVLVPYLVADPAAIGIYYAVGFVGPPFLGMLSVVTTVSLAAGSRQRSDPATAAGIAIVTSLLVALFSLTWAISVTPSLLGGLTTVDTFQYHRWTLVAAGVLAVIGSAVYARAVV